MIAILSFFTKTASSLQIVFNDIAGWDLSYEKFMQLCEQSRKDKYSYLKIKRLDDEEK